MSTAPSSLDLAREFPQRPDVLYLNHAAVAPWPRRAAEAVARFARENAETGALHYPRWLATERTLRERLAWLVNAPSVEDVALVKNTSEALSMVAWGLPWEAGDNVVSSDQEFPSNRIVWQSLAGSGVSLREADLSAGASPEEALFARCDGRTRLLTISSVQYASGLRLDLERIGRFCRERGILFCVDAIQSVGALRTDVQAIGADFLMADGHKWLLGPEGLALFYCTPRQRERLRLFEYGWHMVAESGDFERREWTPASSGLRFECGSPNLLAAHALAESTGLLLEVGPEKVERTLLKNTGYLFDKLDEIPGFELLSPRPGARRAGILTFRIAGRDSDALYRALMARKVVCASRGGGVRFSPHFYTPRDVLDRAVAEVAALAP